MVDPHAHRRAAIARFASLAARLDGPDQPGLDEFADAMSGALSPDRPMPGQVMAAIDHLAGRFLERGVGGGTAELCAWLFIDEGLVGDRAHYEDPANGLIDQVLHRRRGIPITLSLIAVEVGRRVERPLVGIGMPGHFLLRDALDPGRYFDPFRSGLQIDAEGAEVVFRLLHGERAPFDRRHLAVAPTREWVRRMLANLERFHRHHGDRESVAVVLELMVTLPDSPAVVRARLADLLAAIGRFDEAAVHHDHLARLPGANGELHRNTATGLRSRLN